MIVNWVLSALWIYALYFFGMLFIFSSLFLGYNIYAYKGNEKEMAYYRLNVSCITIDAISIVILRLLFFWVV